MSERKRRAERVRLTHTFVLVAAVATLVACGVARSATPTPAQIAPTPGATATPWSTATRPASATPEPVATASLTATGEQAGAFVATATPLPAGPAPSYTDVRDAVLAYLEDSDGSVAGMAAAVEKWGMAPPVQAEGVTSAGPPAQSADFDGDGVDEVVVVLEDPYSTSVVGNGTVLIVDRAAGEYSVAYDSGGEFASLGAVSLLAVVDADGDSVADLSYTSESCGAHTCYYTISVISHHSGAYVDLSPSVSVTYPDIIALRDEAGDARLEIVVHGGTFGSVGAGVQRASTSVYALSDGAYTLADVRYDPSDLLYFTVADASLALAEGRVAESIALYEKARDDEALKPSGVMLNGMTEAEEDEALRSFARFRLVVAHAIAGDVPGTEATADEAATAGGPFAALAAAYWRAYSPSTDVDAGCAAVTEAATDRPDYLDILNAFGYANPTYMAEDVCRGSGAMW